MGRKIFYVTFCKIKRYIKTIKTEKIDPFRFPTPSKKESTPSALKVLPERLEGEKEPDGGWPEIDFSYAVIPRLQTIGI